MSELINVDPEMVKAMVQHAPAKQRAVLSKAIKAAADYANKSLKDYGKAAEYSWLMFQNEKLLGVELNRLFKTGEMKQGGTGRPASNSGNISGVTYATFGVNHKHGGLVRLIASTMTDKQLRDWHDEQLDPSRRVLPKFWQLLGQVEFKEKPETPPPPAGKYETVVIDPPWPMKKIERDVAPDQQAFAYAVMEEDELTEWGGTHLVPILADNAHVWLWTTHKFLPMAMRLLEAWKLKYVCTFVWHKPGGFQPFGLPQYNCEFALYARKGSPEFVETSDFPVCFEAPRTEHSAKPEEFYDLLRRVTRDKRGKRRSRIDMFNRRPIDGFESWGHESE